MRLKQFILIFLSVFCAYSSFAQMKGEIVQSRILILLDESSSMIQAWGGNSVKYKASHQLIMRLMDSVYAVNDQVEFGLRVFGHQHTVPENDCYDTRIEVPFSKDNRSQMLLRLEDIHPLGVTPISFALQEAATKDIIDEQHNVYSIILITDGGESCGGDICEVMKKLVKYKVYFKPYIVSLENDPALKTTYACMGDFLQVTKESDIPPAVSTIVKAFRPAIRMNTTEYKEVQNITANAPSVLKVNPVKTAPPKADPVTIELLAISGISPVQAKAPQPVRLSLLEVQIPRQKVDVPEPPAAVKIQGAAPAQLKQINIQLPVAGKLKSTSIPPIPQIVLDTPVAPRAQEKIAKLKPAALRTFNVIFVIEDRTFPMRKVPPMPPVKVETVVNKTPDKPSANPTAKKREFKVEVQDDKETTLEVYFTNGIGKYYMSTPQVLLVDPSSKAVVKRFFRTVDPNGNPDPQNNIPAGVYDLKLASSSDFLLPGVRIEQNKKNKVIVTIKNTSLSFAYQDENDPRKLSKRPVTEFSAVVTERNKTVGRVQEQRLTERLEYEPGNYHIVINTFPQDIRNVDIDFDESVITIPQPGFAKFEAEGGAREVTIFSRVGDKFLNLCRLSINDPKSQHFQLQPGEYQAHYQNGTSKFSATEQVLPFRIKPAQETPVSLK
jgi:von Willebrand factor type A domain